jgi:hypothetical protein
VAAGNGIAGAGAVVPPHTFDDTGEAEDPGAGVGELDVPGAGVGAVDVPGAGELEVPGAGELEVPGAGVGAPCERREPEPIGDPVVVPAPQLVNTTVRMQAGAKRKNFN